MPVGPTVSSARDMNPEILAVGGFENQLVKIAMGLNPVKPLASGFEVGMPLVVIPSGIRGKGQLDVGSLA